MQFEVVWARIKISRDYQDDYIRNSARREREGPKKKRWKNNISEWTGLKFCDALRESELKTQWRERVARSVALQRLP